MSRVLEENAKSRPEFNYHLLRNALEGFRKNLSQLQPDERERVMLRAEKSFEIESRALASREAKEIIVSAEQLDQALAEVVSRYASTAEFLADLKSNQLDENSLRRAVYRELLFNHVMQRVAARSPAINELDMRLFYELHLDRFKVPEQRTARHILITVNAAFPENSREAARSRIEEVLAKLGGRINRFGYFARHYSECPTAVEDGKLGRVQPGQLYPELDAALFNMAENEISPIVESEMGFHILFCEKIRPARTMPFSKVSSRIGELLNERQKRNCQKAWLAGLKQAADA
ncbi:MAG: nitrogen fixation protein NifM [Gammaproteobacteria bacterium]